VRVLYVIDSLIGGGAEHSLAHMAPGYRDLGIELHVAFLKSRWNVAEALVEAGATLHPVALDGSRATQLVGLVRLIRALEPDVVHTTLWEADQLGRIAAFICRRPLVSTFANSSYSVAQLDNPAVNRHKLRVAQAVDAVTARLVDRFHAVSAPVARDMSARLRVSSDRIDVVPRARRRDVLGESTAARRDAVRATLRIGESTPVVLAIARHEYQKGLDVLVDAAAVAAAELPTLVVLIAGREGRETAALREHIASAGVEERVRLLGARTDVPDLIVAADVVAVPSRVEGLPGAVLEAMALNRPVVASDIPMVREAIGEHAAALVPLDDVPAFAAALVSALRGSATVAQQVADARRRFDDRFTPDAVVRALVAIYERAATRRRAAST